MLVARSRGGFWAGVAALLLAVGCSGGNDGAGGGLNCSAPSGEPGDKSHWDCADGSGWSCVCHDDGRWMDLERPDLPCNMECAPPPCEYEGVGQYYGKPFTATDGCNTCTCQPGDAGTGHVVCTTNPCNP